MFETFKIEEKRRIFNRPFWKGFYFGVGLFALLNIVAYLYADYRYEQYLKEPIRWAPARRFMWGFPLSWDGYNFGSPADGALNIVVLFLIAFFFGTTFRFIASQTSK